MLKIKVVCPECARQFSVDESHMGKKARCKKCNATFVMTQTEQMGSPKTEAAAVSGLQVSASASEDDLPAEWNEGDVILDLYEVKGVLGEGGMGRVYKVHHRGWDMDLAVKCPKSGCFDTEGKRESFIRECETWINLGLHPHTVSCYYVRRLGGIPRVFAEFVEGGSLSDWIHRGKLYDGGPQKALERVLDIAIQFAWGLQYAHEQGVIHQDVKPANVMMTKGSTAKVTDFGLAGARSVTGEKPAVGRHGQTLVVPGAGLCTREYASPEQIDGKPLTRQTDIWSWALSVLEMFAGQMPPYGPAAAELLENFLEEGAEDERIRPMPKSLADLLH